MKYKTNLTPNTESKYAVRQRGRALLMLAMLICSPLHGASNDVRQLLIKWKGGPTSPAAAEGNAVIGSKVKRSFGALGWQVVELPASLTLSDGMAAYRHLEAVLTVEPNGSMTSSAPLPTLAERAIRAGTPEAAAPNDDRGFIPNDPLFAQQWSLRAIGATNAWATTTGSSNVIVAVMDTGVDYTHPDLAANMWRNPGETGLDANGHDKATNGIDDDGNGYIDDVYGINVVHGTGDPMDIGYWTSPSTNVTYHGTEIASCIGAVGNNGLGLCGVNWSVQILAIRFWGGDWADPQFYSPTLFLSDGLAAWDYVISMKRRGINIRVASSSWGGATKSAALRDAILQGGDEGILAVFAATNEAIDQDVFSFFPNASRLWPVINVAASTESDDLAWFSCFGRNTVELAAPGVNLTTATKGGTYRTGRNGTSFACPIVSGAAALLLAANPSLTVNEIKSALFGSVDQPAVLNGKLITRGRLNVARSLDYLINPNPSAIVIHMSPAGQQSLASEPIRMTFNRPMDRASIEASFSVSPPIDGIFVWAEDNRSFAFTHGTPFDVRTNYTVRLSGTALDEVGGSLDGNFNRSREGSPTDDFVWAFHFPIANDEFADAQVITGPSGSLQASNRYAFIEVGEPAHVLGDQQGFGSSLWYRWTAPESGGWFSFDLTSGTSFDSLLAVYVGEALGQLLTIAGNDNYGIQLASRVSLSSIPATRYSIVVASKSELDPNQAGNFKLTWYPTPPPVIASFAPTSAYPGQKVILNGTNFSGATRVLFNGVSAVFAFSTNVAFTDLQLTAIVPAETSTGPIIIQTPHGNFTTTSNFAALVLPQLSARSLPGNLVELSWPSTTGFNLQRADSLSSTSLWTTAAVVSPRLTNGIRIVMVTNAVPNRFFRLNRP